MIWENICTLVWSTGWYFALTLLLPSICLRKYVKQKELTYRFFFYQCTGNLYLDFIVLLLGFAKIINWFTLFLFLVLIPLGLCCFRDRKQLKQMLAHASVVLQELTVGSYGEKLLLSRIKNKLRDKCKQAYVRYLKGRVFEFILFAAVMVWVLYFYGEYKYTSVAYGHTDEETHLYWIGELIHGNIFPAGMYPHGMHAVVAAITVLSGMTLSRVYLMFSVISTGVIFSSSYMLFRKLLGNRYAVLGGWSVFVLTNIFAPITYIRFQISFPMEFGLIAAFSMIYFMLYSVQHKEKLAFVPFALSISWTLMIHFYVTIFCGVICVCFGLVYFVLILKRKLLISYLIAGAAGVLVACIPYGVGMVAGHEFERSIAWALGITQASVEEDVSEKSPEEIELLQIFQKENFWGKQEICLSQNFVKQRSTARYLMILDAVLLAYGFAGLLFSKKKEKYLRYIFWAVLWEAGALLASSYYLNIPAIIEVKRMAMFLTFLSIPLFMLPFEILAQIANVIHIRGRKADVLLGAIIFAELGAFIYTANVKDGRIYWVTLSEGDAKLCLDLQENSPKHTWTVISPVNDLSMIRYDGYHYEIVDLIKNLDEDEDIYIPTPDIYVMTEKKVISFNNDVRQIDHSDMVSPENVKEISPELALTDIDFLLGQDDIHQADAPYYFQRDVVMSKLYYWVKAIQEVYPNHISVYYEDEQVCVYHIEQDAYFLLNLSVDYQMLAEQDKE